MDRIAATRRSSAADHSAIFLPEPDGTTYRAIVAEGEDAEAMRDHRGGRRHHRQHDRKRPRRSVNDAAHDARGVRIPGTEDDTTSA